MANYTLTAAINEANTPIGVTPAYAHFVSGSADIYALVATPS